MALTICEPAITPLAKAVAPSTVPRPGRISCHLSCRTQAGTEGSNPYPSSTEAVAELTRDYPTLWTGPDRQGANPVPSPAQARTTRPPPPPPPARPPDP